MNNGVVDTNKLIMHLGNDLKNVIKVKFININSEYKKSNLI